MNAPRYADLAYDNNQTVFAGSPQNKKIPGSRVPGERRPRRPRLTVVKAVA